jgi:hypothetical protein
LRLQWQARRPARNQQQQQRQEQVLVLVTRVLRLLAAAAVGLCMSRCILFWKQQPCSCSSSRGCCCRLHCSSCWRHMLLLSDSRQGQGQQQ